MLSFIDCTLRVIKQVHDNFMGGLDIIMSGDFYQVPPIQNSWIFRPKLNEIDIFGTYFWNEHVKCFELKQIMPQTNTNFINILNQFRTTLEIHHNINFMSQICLKKPPLDTTLPYLFYTNVKIIEHIKKTFQNTLGETFKFVVQDIHLDTCVVHF
jgi:hypothetical protein